MKISKGQIVELEIDRLAFGGAGIGNYEGLVFFVPFSSPGDLLKVKVTKSKKSFCEAEIVEILKPSTSRVEAPCKYFGDCGGCDFQHISYQKEVEFKRQALETLLKKKLKSSLPHIEIEAAKNEFHYRSRIQLNRRKGRVGYFKKGSKDLVEIKDCMIAKKQLSEHIVKIKTSSSRFELLWNASENRVEVKDTNYGGSEGSFTQANEIMNVEMQKLLVSQLQVEPKKFHFVELYSGDGNFTHIVDKNFDCFGFTVELNQVNVKRALEELKPTSQLHLHCAPAESWNDYLSDQPIDHMLIDPPRKGLSPQVLESIIQNKPKNLHYISCHPAALARDLHELEQSFEIEMIKAFDMFPKTGHLEVFVSLKLKPEVAR